MSASYRYRDIAFSNNGVTVAILTLPGNGERYLMRNTNFGAGQWSSLVGSADLNEQVRVFTDDNGRWVAINGTAAWISTVDAEAINIQQNALGYSPGNAVFDGERIYMGRGEMYGHISPATTSEVALSTFVNPLPGLIVGYTPSTGWVKESPVYEYKEVNSSPTYSPQNLYMRVK